jgi:eukaryotic-like serine/threonine-protein kinase
MSELCSLCQAVEAGPYCPVNGGLHRSFVIGDHYEVQELLGAAMDSFVFGARDHQHGRWVAAALQPSHLTGEQVAGVRAAQERFVREMASLDTRNRERAVGIIDFGWDDEQGVTYLVACRVDDPMLRPSLDEVEAMLRALREEPIARGTPAPHAAAHAAVALPSMIGSYDVIGALGAGGTGRVYLGQHPVIGSRVAIKVLLPEIARSAETVERFIQEARASSQIASPHIPRYFDFGTTADGLPYAIMEYFEGETLGVRLGRVGTLSVSETAQVVEQIASALLMAHDAGLIHRDLKPDNILLVNPDSKGSKSAPMRAAGSSSDLSKAAIEVKVLDFGIAKVIGNRSPNRTLTGSFLGTPYYCAPEQVFGHEVDARTDVYSLGATAFEMLTGAPPFVGAVPVILSSKATEEAPDLARRGVPPRVANTIRRMLAREPRHRAPSMAWVLEQVAGWQTSGELSEIDVAADRVPRDEATVVDWNPAAMHAAVTETSNRDDLSSTTTSDAIRAVAPPRGVRTWIAIAVTGAALAVGAAAALLGASSRSTASTSSVHSTPAPSKPAGTSPNTAATSPDAAVASPNAAAASPNAAAASPTAGSPNAAVASPNAAAPSESRPQAPSPGAARQGKPVDDPTSGRAVQRRPPKPSDKKPAKKPATTRAPTDPKDILIVDPFSSTRSDSR